MSRYLTGLLVALAVALAGCGGGGGGTDTGNDDGGTTKDPTQRTITGKVVSSEVGNPPVAHAIVTMGVYTVETGADGVFKIGPMPVNEEIPSKLRIDVSGVGVGFNRDDLITVKVSETKSNYYLYDAIDIPVAVRNGDSNNLGTFIARYAADDHPSIPYPDKDTIIAGRLVREDLPNVGIAGATVTFGTAVITRTQTGKNGYFALNVGRNVFALSLFLTSERKFSVSIPNGSVPGITTPVQVKYLGQTYPANGISVPEDVLTDVSTDLGNVIIKMGNSSGGDDDDGDTPPPPPI